MKTRLPEHRLLALALPGAGPRERAEMAAIAAAGPDWKRIREDAGQVGALALLGRALERAGIAAPAEVGAACREALVQGTLRGLLAVRILGDLLRALEHRGIEALVLKGSPLAHELYDDPGLRPVGDIDLLVRPQDREGALRTLGEAGYGLPAGSLPLEFFRRHHFHITLVRHGEEGLPIELHWDAQPAFSLSRIPADGLRERARPVSCGGLQVLVPGREECFLYLAQHLIRHLLVFGAETAHDPVAALLEPARRGRLTWIADLVLLCRREPGLDWALIGRRSAEWGLEEEIAGLRRYLASLGAAPAPDGDTAGALPGERRLRMVRGLSRLLPSAAKASGALQLRPLLAFELVRYAFPGRRWIRWRHPEAAARGRLAVAAWALGHAMRVFVRAARMGLAVAAGRIGPERRRACTRATVPGAVV